MKYIVIIVKDDSFMIVKTNLFRMDGMRCNISWTQHFTEVINANKMPASDIKISILMVESKSDRTNDM